MTAPGEWRCDLDELPPGRTATFRLTCGGRTVHGFAINHAGRLHAYVNSCPHVGTPLDMWPNEFLTEDGSTLVCATHGALFAPDSGECITGPCAGDRLEALAVRVEGRVGVVSCAEP
jgi:nitrite reductase/ring-hydroxylating ferredoxin subunit